MSTSTQKQVNYIAKLMYQSGMPKAEQKLTGTFANTDTLEGYKSCWSQILNFMKNELEGQPRGKDIQRLTSEIVQKWFKEKIEEGKSESYIQGISSAIGALEEGLRRLARERGNMDSLEKYGVTEYNFLGRKDIVKKSRKKESFTSTNDEVKARFYEHPEKLVNTLRKEEHRLFAKVQLEGGPRVQVGVKGIRNTVNVRSHRLKENNLGHIQPIRTGVYRQMRGIKKDKYTGKLVGQILTVEKGGKAGMVQVSEKTYRDIENYIANHGELRIKYEPYLRDLKKTASSQKQLKTDRSQASHGLRHNFCRNRVDELRGYGFTNAEVRQIASWEMKHFRGETTEMYLKD